MAKFAYTKLKTFDPADEICFGSLEVSKSDIQACIRGQSEDDLHTNNFYTAYIYADGRLRFLSISSQSHLSGRLSIFTPALIYPGKYFLQDDQRYFVLTHEPSGKMTVMIEYEPPDAECLNLSDYSLDASPPKTAFLKWSLSSRTVELNLIAGVFLFIAIAWYIFNMNSYRVLSTRAHELMTKQAAQKQSAVSDKTLPDYGVLISRLIDVIGPDAVIRSFKIDTTKIVFNIRFKTEDAARQFLKTSPVKSRYDGANVVLEFTFQEAISKLPTKPEASTTPAPAKM